MSQGGASHQAYNQYPPRFHHPVHHHSRQAPPALVYQPPTQAQAFSSQSTLENALKAFMQLTGQSINEVKNATMVNTQAIAKMETQIGQIVNHLGEREKGKLPSQPLPNPRLQFQWGSSSNAVQGQEHVQAIVSLRLGRQVDNQVVLPEENLVAQQEQGSGSTKEKDAEPSTALLRPLLGRLYLRHPTLTDYLRPRNEGSSRTFWRYSRKCKSTSHFWMPSSRCRLMPSS
jgi:hypothetical protein